MLNKLRPAVRLDFVAIVICLVYIFILLVVSRNQDSESALDVEQLEKTWEEKKSIYDAKIGVLRNEVEQLKVLALDPYKSQTLTTENDIVFQDYEPNNRHAIVTMIGSDSYMHAYWMGAMALVQGLREAQTRVPNIIVMIREHRMTSVPKFAIKAFERLGAKVVPIEGLPMDELPVDIPGTWLTAFDKLTVWTLTDYDKVLFLDADTLVVQNIDHLLNEPELTAPYTPRNCACGRNFDTNPEYFTLSSGFFVLKPSMERFEQMVTLASGTSPDPDDLEQFGGVWHWGDQEMLRVVFTQLTNEWNHLNWQYDLPVGQCSCRERRMKPVYSYHFVCTFPVPKPWALESELYDPAIESCVREIYHLWFRMFAKAINHHEIYGSDRAPKARFIRVPKPDIQVEGIMH